jgi:hypothetical protein
VSSIGAAHDVLSGAPASGPLRGFERAPSTQQSEIAVRTVDGWQSRTEGNVKTVHPRPRRQDDSLGERHENGFDSQRALHVPLVDLKHVSGRARE